MSIEPPAENHDPSDQGDWLHPHSRSQPPSRKNSPFRDTINAIIKRRWSTVSPLTAVDDQHVHQIHQPRHPSPGHHAYRHSPLNQTSLGPRRSFTHVSSSKSHLTFLNGFALVISLQIGAGIFSTPSIVLAHSYSNHLLALSIWLLAGTLASTGAASFVELGVAVPLNGGLHEYVRHCYGEFAGFAAAFTLVLIVQPAATGMIALVGAGYLRGLFPVTGSKSTAWIEKFLAVLSVAMMTGLNCAGASMGTRMANVFLAVKVTAIGSIIIAMLSSLKGQLLSRPSKAPIALHTTNLTFGSLVDAALAALLTYQGWENLGYVAGELHDPRRTVPRILFSAMLFVVALFALVNLGYFAVVSAENMVDSNTVALDFGQALLGTSGGIIFALTVSASCLGAMNAKIFAVGRLTNAAVRRGYLPQFLASARERWVEVEPEDVPPPVVGINIAGVEGWTGFNGGNEGVLAGGVMGEGERPALLRQHSHFRPVAFGKDVGETPVRAMLLSAGLTSLYIIFGSFRTLVTFASWTLQTLLFITVLGLFRHRFLHPVTSSESLPHRYSRHGSYDHRTELDPLTAPANLPHVNVDETYRTNTANPVIYCIVTALVVLRGAVEHPIMVAAVMGMNGVGLSLFAVEKTWGDG